MIALTRRQMRDRIRRNLGLVPAIDVGEGPEGEPTSNQPFPTNKALDQYIEEAVTQLNLRAGISIGRAVTSLDIEAQTDTGPYRVSLDSARGQNTDGDILQVRRAWWQSNDTVYRLEATSRDAIDRIDDPWPLEAAGTPRRFWMEGGQIWLSPAPAVAGTLNMVVGVCMLAPLTDDDGIPDLPADLYPIVTNTATWLAGGDDKYIALAVQGQDDVTRWLSAQNRLAPASIIADTRHRQYRGRR